MGKRLDSLFFFFNDTATTEIYTLSLHDALPICVARRNFEEAIARGLMVLRLLGISFPDKPKKIHILVSLIRTKRMLAGRDRKRTRLNSSHANISYAVFCLKKKKLIHDYSYAFSF